MTIVAVTRAKRRARFCDSTRSLSRRRVSRGPKSLPSARLDPGSLIFPYDADPKIPSSRPTVGEVDAAIPAPEPVGTGRPAVPAPGFPAPVLDVPALPEETRTKT